MSESVGPVRRMERMDITPEPSFSAIYIFSLDHKMIGRQFLFVGLLMLMIGGFSPCWCAGNWPGRNPPVPGLSLSLNPIFTANGGDHSAADL